MQVMLRMFAVLGIALATMGARAEADNSEIDVSTANAVVRQTTERVMAVVEGAQAYANSDPKRYYDQIQEILDPVVDFRGFARGVMGPYASSERYKSLDSDGREQLKQHLDNFTEVMRSSMVRTYSKGLQAFAGSRFEVSDPAPGEKSAKRASIKQLIFSDKPDPYVVLYQMGRNRQGDWKLRNMIIENVNLGEIYRNQFESSARKYGGQLDKVIANWSAVEVET